MTAMGTSRGGRLTLLLTLVLTAMLVVAIPATAHQPPGSSDVSATTTTDPADASVYVQLMQLENDENDICSTYSDAEEAYKAEGSTGTFIIEPGVVLTISGDKTSGYTYSLTGGVLEDVFLKSSVKDNNWYHFEPGVRYASPLFTGTDNGLSHSIICWTPGAPSTDLDVTSPASGAITVYENDPVNLTFSEENDGDFTLTNVYLTSDDAACNNSLSPVSVASLAPGGSQSFTCSTSFTSFGTYTVNVYGHGTYDGKDVTYCENGVNPDPATTICDQDEIASVTVTVLRPSTDLTLDDDSETTVVYGDDATLYFLEENDALDGTSLTNVSVTLASGSDPCAPDPLTLVSKGHGSIENNDNTLDPGEAWLFSCTVSNVTSAQTVTVEGHGTTPLGQDVTWNEDCELGTEDPNQIFCDPDETATASITVLTPSTTLSITNGAGPIQVPVGTSVQLSFAETNDGDVDLTNPSVVVDNCTAAYSSGDTDTDGVLDVGETWVWTCTVDTSVVGSTTYTATGHGTDPLGRDVTYCSGGEDPTAVFCDQDERDSITVEVYEVGEGCTPGYWRNHHDSWAATGYSPSDLFDDVFGTNFNESLTLGEAIEMKGGQLNAVVRHVTAALLNAAHPDVDYAYSEGEVLQLWEDAQSDWQGVLADLVAENEAGCPIS